MTAINTDKMKELEARAMPGPWNCSDGFIWCADGDLFGHYRGEGRIEPDDPNATFITAARSFVPWAIAEIERLEDELLQALAAIKSMSSMEEI